VVGPVVLDDQPGFGVVQVRSCKELVLVIKEFYLDVWAWQAALDEEPSEAGLHWRFRRRRKRRKETKSGAAREALKRSRIRQTLGQCHVDRDQGFYGRQSKA
jgi:hypothetical protein